MLFKTDNLKGVEAYGSVAKLERTHQKSILYEPCKNTCQAQTLLANREQWASEIAKQIATHHQAFRGFVERPASDLALLEALTASGTSAATGVAPPEDLFAPPAAKAAAAAAAATSSAGAWETKGQNLTGSS